MNADAELYLLQTAPCVQFVDRCDAGHLHVTIGWVSYVEPGPKEATSRILMHPTSGEFWRPAIDLTFSLN